MTPIIFKTKLTWLKLDVREFAKEIDVPLKHVEAWRSGKRKVPVVVEKLIDALCRLQRLDASAKKKKAPQEHEEEREG